MQDSFAFIIHPLNPKRDVGRKYPALGKLPAWLIEFLSIFYPPVLVSEIVSNLITESTQPVKSNELTNLEGLNHDSLSLPIDQPIDESSFD